MTRRHTNALYRTIILLVLLGLWQTLSGRFVSPFFISSPVAVFTTFWGWLLDGTLFFHAAITATEAFTGFLLGSLFGIAIGILLARAERLADVLNPFIMAFYSLPKVALAPLFVLWFGIGMDMKVIMTGAVVFFLVFLNTYTGVRNVDRDLVSILRLMGANERHLLSKVIIPSAITWVFTGLRISVPYALIGAIVGELVAANRGLGFLLADSAGQFNTAGVFAALAAIMILSFCLSTIVKLLEAYAMPWKAAEAGREATV
jgi:NitT/TauT family transport system permease protein